MQIVSTVFWKNKKNIFKVKSAEIFSQHARNVKTVASTQKIKKKKKNLMLP